MPNLNLDKIEQQQSIININLPVVKNENGYVKSMATLGMDGAVANSALINSVGSGCCIVSDAETNYLLTNCHVMTGKYLQNPLYNTNQPDVTYADARIGAWKFGSMTSAGDFALVEIEDVDGFIENYSPELFNAAPREIVNDDWLNLQVQVRGDVTKVPNNGYIIEVVQNQVTVGYKLGASLLLDTAILIGDRPDKDTCSPVTQEGDSGGAVYDDQNNLIGIIVSKDDSFTYAIPLSAFLNNLNLTIK